VSAARLKPSDRSHPAGFPPVTEKKTGIGEIHPLLARNSMFTA
jgi:hypothetical protein